MFNGMCRRSSMMELAAATIVISSCASVVHAQSPAVSVPLRTNALMTQDVVEMPGMEVTMSTVEYAPGASSPPHSHGAHVFVYVLEGHVIMQVRGGPQKILGPGETFYESPTDIHSVSANASTAEPAKFIVFMLKNKNVEATSTPSD